MQILTNFRNTLNELEVLVTSVEKSKDFLFGKFTNTVSGDKRKKSAHLSAAPQPGELVSLCRPLQRRP